MLENFILFVCLVTTGYFAFRWKEREFRDTLRSERRTNVKHRVIATQQISYLTQRIATLEQGKGKTTLPFQTPNPFRQMEDRYEAQNKNVVIVNGQEKKVSAG